jgi:outer membrane lipoprotein SlyB
MILREKNMRKFSIGLGLAMLSLLALQGCASNDAASGQASSASSGGGNDGEIVTGSRIPRKAPKPSENVVIKDASEKTGL